jgi:sec-independent protein translocase protein TatB
VFNVGPLEIMVLAIVGLIVLGPDRLPGLAKDAARLVRTLRELATGARTQLQDELGPEFADLDLRSLNPRTAIQRVLLGEDEPRPEQSAASTEQLGRLEKPAARPPSQRPPSQRPLAADEPAPYDNDAT